MKKSLRQKALLLRRQMSAQAVKTSEDLLLASIHTLLQSRMPCTVGLFYPTQGEPNLMPICGFPDLAAVVWSLPVCSGSENGPLLQFARHENGAELAPGRYGIPVPARQEWVEPDVLLIPCLAFHRGGARLGYGAGWYDRTLAHIQRPLITIGIAYANSEVMVPFAEPHDRLLNYILTENEVIKVQSDPE